MSFNSTFKKYASFITEADAPPPPPPPPPPEDDAPPAEGQDAPPPPPAAPEPASEPKEDVLSSQGEVLLAKLCVKCFSAKPEDDDLIAVSRFGEINEKNARKVVDKMRELIKKYTSDDI